MLAHSQSISQPVAQTRACESNPPLWASLGTWGWRNPAPWCHGVSGFTRPGDTGSYPPPPRSDKVPTMASCLSKGKNQVLIQAIFGLYVSMSTWFWHMPGERAFSRGKIFSFLQALPIHIINACVMLAMLKIIIFENNYTLI